MVHFATAAPAMRYLAPAALLADGWHDEVVLEIDAGGIICGIVEQDAGALPVTRLAGPVVAGVPNLHSHAFQRAMAGLTETAGPRADSFWSWRELMYRFLADLSPEDCEAIAAQLYMEMLERGYTAVAEFHYLHHQASGQHYASRAQMGLHLCAAAQASGIRMTLLPTFYAHANFGGVAPLEQQRRFINDVDGFARIVDELAVHLRALPLQKLGVAAHSLRAVTPSELDAVVSIANAHGPDTPIHIHIAEQIKEVEDCRAWCGTTPVRWLLDHAALSARWCVVHATHMYAAETVALAESGAIVGLCPTTEGDLGDGFFNGVEFLGAGGGFGIGGDSHAEVDPFVELRLFEYTQRLRHQRRNLLASEPGQSLGSRLFEQACSGGARALGQDIGRIGLGACADLVVLNSEDCALVARRGAALLDSAIFGPARQPVRDVMVGGVWQVRDGVHLARGAIEASFRRVMQRLLK